MVYRCHRRRDQRDAFYDEVVTDRQRLDRNRTRDALRANVMNKLALRGPCYDKYEEYSSAWKRSLGDASRLRSADLKIRELELKRPGS